MRNMIGYNAVFSTLTEPKFYFLNWIKLLLHI